MSLASFPCHNLSTGHAVKPIHRPGVLFSAGSQSIINGGPAALGSSGAFAANGQLVVPGIQDVAILQALSATPTLPTQSAFTMARMKGPQSVQATQAEIYYILGDRYYQANHFTHALEALNEAIRLNPLNEQAYNKRGVVKTTTKDYAGAFADYSSALSINPNFYKAYINRGNLWVYLSELARKQGNQSIATQGVQMALADYSQAIRLNPLFEAAYENRSELYTNLGMHTEALQDKGKAIQLQKMKAPQALGMAFRPPRIALVLANDDYDGTANDLNGGPIRDASQMANLLRTQGFYVITGTNLTGEETKAKVAEFVSKLLDNPNAVSLTYYSGHGGSINGNNYIIPRDYTGAADPSFAHEAVSVDYLLRQLKTTNSLFNMIFLDACRTPLPEGDAAFKSGHSVFKQWETEPGPGLANTWIEYASRPRQPAMQDNDEGLYTKYLLQFMSRPDLSLKEVSMYTSYALESDPTAILEKQHSRTQTDLSRTEPLAESFSFARPDMRLPMATHSSFASATGSAITHGVGAEAKPDPVTGLCTALFR